MQAAPGDLLPPRFETLQVVDWLRHQESRPGPRLLGEPQELQGGRIGIRRRHGAQTERTGPLQSAFAQKPAVTRQVVVGLQQLHGVDVVDVPGGTVAAQGLMGAAGAQQIADPQGLRAQRLGNQSDAVPVPRGHVENRLQPLGLQQGSRRQRRHGDPVPVVADAHGVNLPGVPFGGRSQRRRIGTPWRVDLRQKNRFAGCNSFLEAGCLCAHAGLLCSMKWVYPQGTDALDRASDELFQLRGRIDRREVHQLGSFRR